MKLNILLLTLFMTVILSLPVFSQDEGDMNANSMMIQEQLKEDKFKTELKERLELVKKGERDFYF